MIRQPVAEAKHKNSLETESSNFTWKVRGTPKTGLIIKRFTKVKTKFTETEENNAH